MSTNKVAVAEPVATRKSSRRTQERTEITRAKLLEAAGRLFTEHGFEGVSIRDLENAAKVQRGLLAYHFKNKKTLWKAMADATFNLMHEQLNSRLELLEDLSARERIAYIIRFYVRFSSRHPELSRLLSQEARHDSWRIHYLAENHISDLADSLRGPVIETLGLSERQFMHWYYLLAGGSSLIFSHAPECQLVFGEDAHQDSVVDEHAEMMVTALLGSRA
jgi:TetR/AcrR family transcriptional regulator